MKSPLITSLLAVAAISSAGAQISDQHASRPFPMIEWKYGWRDGMRANTIGSARNGDPIPLGTSYVDSGYTPNEIGKAYGFNLIPSQANGTGQIIAVIDAFGSANIQSDLDVFCDTFHLPRTNLQIYYPNGYPDTSDPAYSGWASETTLDVEWSHAMAPGATIVLVVDADGSMTDQAVQYAVTNLNANIVSMSYGNTEYPSELTEDSFFQSPGTVFLAATGDNKDVCYPATSTNVIAVGGTSLAYNNQTGLFSESAWSDSGGGISQYESLPPFQKKIQILNSFRGIPDVSYDADPNTGVSVYFTDPTLPGQLGSWQVVGGTSAAVPQWAALLARRASLGQSNDAILPLLYSKQTYLNATNSWPLKDITTGSSTYRATLGYDLATGLGSPYAAQVAALSPSLQDPAQIISAFPEIPPQQCGASFAIIPPAASSGLPVKVSVLSGNATITNNLTNVIIKPTSVGMVFLAANQPGTTNYFKPAPEVTTSFKVNKGNQYISPFALGFSSKVTTSPPFSIVAPTSSAGLPVVVTVKSGPAKIKNSLISLTKKAGTVVLAANQVGNVNYHSAAQVTTSFSVTYK